MNVEQLEHELNIRKGAAVIVVRPGFGTQSESWEGILTLCNRNAFPLIFQVQAPRGANIFRADDVVSVENTLTNQPSILIRLKGPNDYLGRPVVPQ